MLAAIEVLKSYPGTRRVFICGQMMELGEKSQQYHRQLGQRLGCSGLDLLLAVGTHADEVIAGAISAGLDRQAAHGFELVDQAAAALPALLARGDVVLLKGSRSLQLERLLEPLAAAFGPKYR